MRYFLHLAYNGTNYAGWQRQPNASSVQQTLEAAMGTILGATIEVVGCGRTDTGVHASTYYVHFDYDGPFPRGWINRLNKFLPTDIVVYDMMEVPDELHARYNATKRSYAYHIVHHKNPFRTNTAWFYPFAQQLEIDKLQAAARMLLDYQEFFPFCKTHSDAKTMACDLFRSEWEVRTPDQEIVYHISANRFLRGMVRLIVGMCVNVGIGKLELATVQEALDRQERLQRSYSAPPQGLFLTEVVYPELG